MSSLCISAGKASHAASRREELFLSFMKTALCFYQFFFFPQFYVFIYEQVDLNNRLHRSKSISRSMNSIVQQFLNATHGDMYARIGRGIIYIYCSVFIRDPSVGKSHIGNVPDPFFTFRCKKISGWFIDLFGRVLQIRHKNIKYIAQTRGGIPNAMGEVQPPERRFDRGWTLAVF